MWSELKSGPRLFAAGGALLAVVSSFLPWLRAAGLSSTYEVTPWATPYLQVTVWVECLLLIVGVVVLVVARTPALLGCAGALWFNTSAIVWIFGSRTSSFLPKEVLPENLTVRLAYGADVGLVAGLLVVVGAVLVLAEQSWPHRHRPATDWLVPSAVVVTVLLVGARESIWMNLEAVDFRWELTVDAVPLLGDALLLALLIAAVVALLVSFVDRVWFSIVGVVTAVVIVILSVIGLLAEGAVTDVAEWLTDRADFLDGQSVLISTRPGPFVVLGAGIAMLLFCVVHLIRAARSSTPSRQSSRREPHRTEAAIAPPVLPF